MARRSRRRAGETFGKAKACISDLQLWRPVAHRYVRSRSRTLRWRFAASSSPIATACPAWRSPSICRGWPGWRIATRIVRSVSHIDNDHAVGTYLALTGYPHPRSRPLGIEPPATPQDLPSLGSVVSKVRPADRSMFSYVTLGDLRHLGNNDSMGQNAGCLGRAYDPFTVPFMRPDQRRAGYSGRHLRAGRRRRRQLGEPPAASWTSRPGRPRR